MEIQRKDIPEREIEKKNQITPEQIGQFQKYFNNPKNKQEITEEIQKSPELRKAAESIWRDALRQTGNIVHLSSGEEGAGYNPRILEKASERLAHMARVFVELERVGMEGKWSKEEISMQMKEILESSIYISEIQTFHQPMSGTYPSLGNTQQTRIEYTHQKRAHFEAALNLVPDIISLDSAQDALRWYEKIGDNIHKDSFQRKEDMKAYRVLHDEMSLFLFEKLKEHKDRRLLLEFSKACTGNGYELDENLKKPDIAREALLVSLNTPTNTNDSSFLDKVAPWEDEKSKEVGGIEGIKKLLFSHFWDEAWEAIVANNPAFRELQWATDIDIRKSKEKQVALSLLARIALESQKLMLQKELPMTPKEKEKFESLSTQQKIAFWKQLCLVRAFERLPEIQKEVLELAPKRIEKFKNWLHSKESKPHSFTLPNSALYPMAPFASGTQTGAFPSDILWTEFEKRLSTSLQWEDSLTNEIVRLYADLDGIGGGLSLSAEDSAQLLGYTKTAAVIGTGLAVSILTYGAASGVLTGVGWLAFAGGISGAASGLSVTIWDRLTKWQAIEMDKDFISDASVNMLLGAVFSAGSEVLLGKVMIWEMAKKAAERGVIHSEKIVEDTLRIIKESGNKNDIRAILQYKLGITPEEMREVLLSSKMLSADAWAMGTAYSGTTIAEYTRQRYIMGNNKASFVAMFEDGLPLATTLFLASQARLLKIEKNSKISQTGENIHETNNKIPLDQEKKQPTIAIEEEISLEKSKITPSEIRNLESLGLEKVYIEALLDFEIDPKTISGWRKWWTEKTIERKKYIQDQIIEFNKEAERLGTQKLLVEDAHIIFGYTSDLFYKRLNGWLWNNKYQTSKLTKLMDSALWKMKQVEGKNLTQKRYDGHLLDDTLKQLNLFKKSRDWLLGENEEKMLKEIILPPTKWYLSSSTHWTAWFETYPYRLTIQNSSAKDITKFSIWPNFWKNLPWWQTIQESLFPRWTIFKIKSVKSIETGVQDWKTTYGLDIILEDITPRLDKNSKKE